MRREASLVLLSSTLPADRRLFYFYASLWFPFYVLFGLLAFVVIGASNCMLRRFSCCRKEMLTQLTDYSYVHTVPNELVPFLLWERGWVEECIRKCVNASNLAG